MATATVGLTAEEIRRVLTQSIWYFGLSLTCEMPDLLSQPDWFRLNRSGIRGFALGFPVLLGRCASNTLRGS
jgi:hypothetical protein